MTSLTSLSKGVEAKLDRAEEQLNAQDREWVDWREHEQPWGAHAEVSDDYQRLIFIFDELKPIPPRFGVIAGEIVHDMRSALDHLASYLVQLHGSQPTLVTAWPLEPSPWGWRRKVERRNRPWQLWRKEGAGPLKGIPRHSNAWALIKGSQPYIRSDSARDDALWGLHQLWNADKHRVINAIRVYVKTDLLLNGFTIRPHVEPLRRKVLIPKDRPLKQGAKLALLEFAAPVPHVSVDLNLSVDIALSTQEGDRDRGSIRETLQIVRNLYESAAALPYPPR